ncbi:MAG: ATP-dependent helicase [Micrococcales bacterium]|nr:ATP-dependent helicase [Micrococcales bacterium]NBR54766.1 ATP-dependent helicase [Micrococcales bacterium]NBT46393.1 ATP-dependent helicase [Actinomycetota bacterium]NBY44139.1 ATP-dependent helicase [Micrococcales bacterium]
MQLEAEQILEALDDRQREAAQSLLGPTVILAGAGTGKTRTITHRIAYGIARGDFSENRVLALTYTNRAAGELRARLRGLGVPMANAKTFHSAALAQLEFFFRSLYAVETPRVQDSKAKNLAAAAAKLKLKLDPNTLRDLASEIEWRKYSMLSLEQYEQAMANRPQVSGLSATKNLEIQQAYESLKLKAKQLDWEDVILLCSGMLRAEPRALAQVQQQYRFLTVDEYQDISPLQQDLLDTWLGDRSDICVVGDPNQTIYSFTGATSNYLENFSGRYPDATVVSLSYNYRSNPEIIRIANKVRAHQSMDALTAIRPSGTVPEVLSFPTKTEEALWLAKEVRKQVQSGIKASQIAVLYRINSQSELIERALADVGLEFQVRGGQRYFNRPEILSAIRMVRAEASMPSGKSLYESVTAIVRALGWQSAAPTEIGKLDQWEALNHFVQIAEELGDAATIQSFATEIEERQRSQHEPTKESVTLSTIHAAKGLEYKNVFIIGASEGYLPISFAKTEGELAEEQRLFYVAVTRAKDNLFITWAKQDVEFNRQNSPSRYLSLFQ